MPPTPKTSVILKWALILGIVIVLNLFFQYAIDVFYKAPAYENFCKSEQVTIIPDTKDKCVTEGGQWTEDPVLRAQPVAVDSYGKTKPLVGSCNIYFTCQKEFDGVQKVYNRNIFIALIALGVISLLGGFALAVYEAVSLGFSLGGVLSLVIATIRYWSDMDDRLRVVVLGFALATLIYVAVKKFKN